MPSTCWWIRKVAYLSWWWRCHYDDVEDSTPEPSVVDRAPPAGTSGEPIEAPLRQTPAQHDLAQADGFEAPDPDEVEPFEAPNPAEEVASDADALRSRMGTAAASAGRVAKQGGEALARFGPWPPRAWATG